MGFTGLRSRGHSSCGHLNLNDRPAGFVRLGLAADSSWRRCAGPLAHDRDAVGVVTASRDALAVVADGQARLGGSVQQSTQRLRAEACLRALVIASWAIRSSSASTAGASRVGASFEGQVHGEVGLRADLAHVVGERRSEAVRGGHVAAQVEDRQPQVRDDRATARLRRSRSPCATMGSRVVEAMWSTTYPREATSWAMPSWISRASRCRSSAVAIVRISSKTRAVSRRMLWASTSRISADTVPESGAAIARGHGHADHPVADPQGQHDAVPGLAVAGRDDPLHRLHLRPALFDHRVVRHQHLLGADAAVAERHQDGALHLRRRRRCSCRRASRASSPSAGPPSRPSPGPPRAGA